MHELKTPKGRKVLVIATANYEARFPDGVGIRVAAVEPATRRRPSASAHGMATIATKPPLDRDSDASRGDLRPMRFYAGRPDPTDPSQFIVEFESGAYRGVMKGSVRDLGPERWPGVDLDLGFWPTGPAKE